MAEKQIKSRKRVRDYGEVYTPSFLVKDMVDMVDKAYEESGEQDAYHILTRTWLEPACGNGNFLVEILRRKLAICEIPLDGVVAVSTLYGIDIQEDNVLETRERLAGMVYERFGRTKQLETAVEYYLRRNFVAGNFLTGTLNTGGPIWFLQDYEDEQLSLFV